MTLDNLIKGLKFLCIILGAIVLSLLLLCAIITSLSTLPTFNNAKFTRFIKGAYCYHNPYKYGCEYDEKILVKKMPKNVFDQYKLMLDYFDSTGLSINDLSKMPEVGDYTMSFYKSTAFTQKYFKIANEYWTKKQHIPDKLMDTYWRDLSEVDLGYISMLRCENDYTKWRILIARSTGIIGEDYTPRREYIEFPSECSDSGLDVVKEDNELFKYYMELKNK